MFVLMYLSYCLALNLFGNLVYLNECRYILIDILLDRVVHLVIMPVAGESLQLMSLVNHSMVMYLALQYKNPRFVSDTHVAHVVKNKNILSSYFVLMGLIAL